MTSVTISDRASALDALAEYAKDKQLSRIVRHFIDDHRALADEGDPMLMFSMLAGIESYTDMSAFLESDLWINAEPFLSVKERQVVADEIFAFAKGRGEGIRQGALNKSFNIMAGAGYSPEAEAYDDEMLVRLAEELEADPLLKDVREHWSAYAADPVRFEKLLMDAAKRIASLQGRVYSCGVPQDVIGVHMSREAYAESSLSDGTSQDTYPLAMYSKMGGSALTQFLSDEYRIDNPLPLSPYTPKIVVNLHPDAFSGYGDEYYAFEAIVIHEMTHHIQHDTIDHGYPADDPRADLFKDIDMRPRTEWRKDDDYGWNFYRLTPHERQAHALQKKLYAIRTGQLVPSESEIVVMDMVRRQQGYTSATGGPMNVMAYEPEIDLSDFREAARQLGPVKRGTLLGETTLAGSAQNETGGQACKFQP